MEINIINNDLVAMLKKSKTPWTTVKEYSGGNWIVNDKIGLSPTAIYGNDLFSQLQLVRMMQAQLKDNTIGELLEEVKGKSLYSMETTIIIKKAMSILLSRFIYQKADGEYESLLDKVSREDLWKIYILGGVLFTANPYKRGIAMAIYPILHKDTKEIVTIYGGKE